MHRFQSIFFLVFSCFIYGQSPSVPLKNLAPPSSPAFVLMDVAPSNIVVPENIRAFSVQVLDAFSGDNSNGLSLNNIALEFQPYWYAERKDMNFFKYNNLTSDKPAGSFRTADDYKGYDIFGDLGKRASISLALMNGSFEVFEDQRSYISVGARTRVLSIVDYHHISTLKDGHRAYERVMALPEVTTIMLDTKIKDKASELEKIAAWQKAVEDLENAVQRKPIFALDVALAYSHFLGNKAQNMSSAFGRFGIWASGDLAIRLPKIDDESYVHLYGIFRYLRDGLNRDAQTNTLITRDATDLGAKLEFEIDKFSFAYEYLYRDNDADDYRSVGTIRYKISPALALNGGFGKNFSSGESTIAILGIQWGLDYGASIDPESR